MRQERTLEGVRTQVMVAVCVTGRGWDVDPDVPRHRLLPLQKEYTLRGQCHKLTVLIQVAEARAGGAPRAGLLHHQGGSWAVWEQWGRAGSQSVAATPEGLEETRY